MNASEVLDAIERDRLRDPNRPAGVFHREIQHPLMQRRADGLWIAQDGTSTAYEVKVTRADLRHELADPEKSVPWQQLVDHFVLAVPDESIFGDDLLARVPESWGVVCMPTRKGGRAMKVLREAPRLPGANHALLLGRVSMRYAYSDLSSEAEKRARSAEYQVKRLEAEVFRLRENAPSPEAALAEKWVDDLVAEYERLRETNPHLEVLASRMSRYSLLQRNPHLAPTPEHVARLIVEHHATGAALNPERYGVIDTLTRFAEASRTALAYADAAIEHLNKETRC